MALAKQSGDEDNTYIDASIAPYNGNASISAPFCVRAELTFDPRHQSSGLIALIKALALNECTTHTPEASVHGKVIHLCSPIFYQRPFLALQYQMVLP